VVAFRDLAGGKVDQHHTGQYAWLNAIVMLDAKTGFAAGGRGHLLRTDDGGATWTRLAGR